MYAVHEPKSSSCAIVHLAEDHPASGGPLRAGLWLLAQLLTHKPCAESLEPAAPRLASRRHDGRVVIARVEELLLEL